MEKLHRAIFKMKTEEGGIFEEFTFSDTGTFPYSDLLERVFQRLITSRILTALNPDYPELILSPESVEYIEDDVYNRLSPTTIQKINSSGENFAHLIS